MSARREAELAEAASRYIAAGWPVFILSSSKVPLANCDRCKREHRTAELMESCTCLTCHGFHASTLEPGRVRRMIREHPRGLLAVRTGAPSGTVVIDVDAPEGIATMRAQVATGKLPRTAVQRTGGGGYHLVYAHPGERIPTVPGKGGPGIDVKADGGYIVVAPSVHPQTRRPYRWLSPYGEPLTPLPPYWAERLRERERGSIVRRADNALIGHRDGYGAAAVAGEVRQVLATPPGQRNHVLNVSAFRLGQLAGGGVLEQDEVIAALMTAAEASGLVVDDGLRSCERTINSGLTAGLAQPRGRG